MNVKGTGGADAVWLQRDAAVRRQSRGRSHLLARGIMTSDSVIAFVGGG